MTLALLITAATGAWADGVGAKIGTTEYATLDQAISSAQDGDIIQLQSDAALTESIIVEKRITIDYNGYIISRVGNTYGGIFWAVDMTFTDSDDTGRGGMKCYYGLYTGSNAKANLCGGRYDDSAETILTGSYNIPTGYEIVNINADGSADADGFISRVVRNYLNDTKTVATMTMPASDVTVNYELVRDMTVDVDATIAERIRIKKENNAYVAVTATELIPAVSDKISGTAVAMTATTDYTAQLQKKTEGDTPTWADATTLSVGTFRYVITGTGLYDGNITTNEFQLFEGYEVTVPAGEYATYFKDEALYVENENAQLYTISSVTESEAVLSDAITVAPANTPLLVYNKSEQDKTFLLIPATEDADAVTPASQFKGTLEAASIPASTSTQDNYALNGKAFVWVKNALNISANKCWLQINYQLASTRANTRSIVGGNGTTGIDAATSDDNEGDYYDLQGRKVEKPNRKGIYIHNGKKVIVR